MQRLYSLIKLPFILLSSLFGSFNYTAPPWFKRLLHMRLHKPGSFAVVIACLAVLVTVAIYSWSYYQNRVPKPVFSAQVVLHSDQVNQQGEYRSALYIEFVSPQQSSASVANLTTMGRAISDGVIIKPNKKGQWIWHDDVTLMFTPDEAWQPGIDYQIHVDDALFSDSIELDSHRIAFATQPLQTKLSELAFVQHPQQAEQRVVTATFNFNYPVLEQSLQSTVSLQLLSAEGESQRYQDYPAQLRVDEDGLRAYITSENIELPTQSTFMRVNVQPGATSQLGGNASKQSIQQQVLVPDKFSLFKITAADIQIIENQQQQPEQILTLEFSDAIALNELQSKLSLYLLPDHQQALGRRYWQSPREVTEQVLSANNQVTYMPVSNTQEASKHHQLKIDSQAHRQLYLRIDGQLRSVNGYVHQPMFDKLLRVPAYPKSLRVNADGSIITSNSEQKLGVTSRGLDAMRISLGQIKPEQLPHLITQTRGDINQPEFTHWSFDEHNLTAFEHQVVPIKNQDPRVDQALSIDLPSILKQKKLPEGLYFLKVSAYDTESKQANTSIEDERLVLITDLGILLKTNADRSKAVFVQSFTQREPVANALVSLLDESGATIQQAYTDASGHAEFPAFSYKDRQQPSVFTVSHAQDTAFIPYARAQREINYSGYDVGGVSAGWQGRQQIKASLLSDRKLYQPGETVNIAGIVKQANLSSLPKLPLQLSIYSPNNQQVSSHKLRLSPSGMFDYQLNTKSDYVSGTYVARLHVIEPATGQASERTGRYINSVEFYVQAFEPDSMTISSDYLQSKAKGWVSDSRLNLHTTLRTLFGTAAQDRRVTGQYELAPSQFTFEQFADFSFNANVLDLDDKQSNQSYQRELAPMFTDSDGKVSHAIDLSQFSHGAYLLQTSLNGFDAAGGKPVRLQKQMRYSPLQYMLGMRTSNSLDYLHLNSGAQVEIMAIDDTEKQIALSDLRLHYYRKEQVSSLQKQANGTYAYQTETLLVPISQQAYTIAQEGNSLRLNTQQAGDFVMRIENAIGHQLLTLNYRVVGSANIDAKLEKSALLDLRLQRSAYSAGDVIEMNIRAPYTGSGLITIEQDKVLAYRWFKSNTLSTVQRIQIPEHLEGNAYVNVTYIRDINSTALFTSPMSYAVAGFSIDRKERENKIALTVAPVSQPGQSIAVDLHSEEASDVILFAVDEGILQAANYQVDHPLDYFLRKQSLGVTTMQMLDLLLPDYRLLQQLSAPGGDMEMMRSRANLDTSKAVNRSRNMNPFARIANEPAVYWSSVQPVQQGTNTLHFSLPDSFTGKARIYAISANQTKLGFAQTSTLLKGAFAIEPSVPLYVAPNDEFDAVLNITNLIENAPTNALVSVELAVSQHLQLSAPAKQTVSLAYEQQLSVSYPLVAKQQLGAAHIQVSVSYVTPDGQIYRTTRQTNISVRPHSLATTLLQVGRFNEEINLDIASDFYAEKLRQDVRVADSPLVFMSGLERYLQTISDASTQHAISAVYPTLAWYSAEPNTELSKRLAMQTQELFKLLRRRQHYDGGFMPWPNATQSDPFTSIHALAFIQTAQNNGLPVPADMHQRILSYVQAYVDAYQVNQLSDSLIAAKAIYLLSAEGRIMSNHIADLSLRLASLDKNWQQSLSAVYLAGSLYLLKQETQAIGLIQQFNWLSDNELGFQQHWSALAANAEYLSVYNQHFSQNPKLVDDQRNAQDIAQLVAPISNGGVNAYALAQISRALAWYKRHHQPQHEDKQEHDLTVLAQLINGEKVPLKAKHSKQVSEIRVPLQTESLEIINHQQQKESLFFIATQSGFIRSAPADKVSNDIEITKQIIDQAGNPVSQARVGEVLTVQLRLRPTSDAIVEGIRIIDILPGGAQLIKDSLPDTSSNKGLSGAQGLLGMPRYIDVREDRLSFYGDIGKRVKLLSYQIRMTASGSFVLPAAFVRSSSQAGLKANSQASMLKVNASMRVEP